MKWRVVLKKLHKSVLVVFGVAVACFAVASLGWLIDYINFSVSYGKIKGRNIVLATADRELSNYGLKMREPSPLYSEHLDALFGEGYTEEEIKQMKPGDYHMEKRGPDATAARQISEFDLELSRPLQERTPKLHHDYPSALLLLSVLMAAYYGVARWVVWLFKA